jgi:hypothetical protein
MFPIAPRFSPICFAQTPPLLAYAIAGPKGKTLHLTIESSILGLSIVSIFNCDWPIKLAHSKKKKEKRLEL